ncbi:MAG: CoA transferase [Chloroflexi bacterium]|nr:CoA transferase [Chloroflexota bacterium]
MRALAGVRVLDCTGFVAGPYCARLLAGLGADVIKIEPPGGDPARSHGPFPGNRPHPEKSAIFVHLNTNKRGAVLDLGTEDGRAAFRDLASGAHVVIEDRSPGELAALGLGYDVLAKHNPGLVMTSITAFGQDGPYRDYRAHHINLFNATEGSTAARARDGRPTMAGGFLGEYDAGLNAGVATLAALHASRLSGRGQHVDISRFESLAALQRVDISIQRNKDQAAGYRNVSRIGGLVPCKDGHVVIIAVEDHQWTSLAELIGRPEWTTDPRFTSREERPRHAPEIQRAILDWAKQHPKDEVYHLGQAAKVPVGAVLNVPELLASPQLRARDFFHEVDHPDAGAHLQPGMGFLLSKSPWRAERPAPRLGEHNGEVLGQRPWGHASTAAPAGQSLPGGTASHPRTKALEGVRVVDFTWAWAGAYATFQLGLLGAEVIKVESLKRLDLSRTQSLTTGQRFAGYDSSTIFNDLNANKRSLQLDLSRPEAVAIAKRLVAESDVVAQNMRPGVMERLGLGYEDLRAVKPDIIMLSSSALGSTGPERTYSGYAPVFSALGGLAYITGQAGGPPVPLYGSVDLRSATMSAFAVMAALHQRDATGEGQHIDLSSVESVASLIGHVFAEYQLTGKMPRRRGNDDFHMAPHNTYPCAGGEWVTIAVETDAEWQSFCAALGNPGWTNDARFAEARSRWRNRRTLDRHVEGWTRERGAAEITTLLQRAGVAALPGWGPEGLAHDAHLEARGFFQPVVHPVLGRREVVGAPWTLPGTPPAIERPAPLLGEHNGYVLADLLGMSPAEVASLQEQGIVH